MAAVNADSHLYAHKEGHEQSVNRTKLLTGYANGGTVCR